MTDLYGHDPMEPSEAQVEEHIASQMTKAERIAEIQDKCFGDEDFLTGEFTGHSAFDYPCDRCLAKIRAIEEEA